MSNPFVSSYDDAFMEAFGRGMQEMPSDLSEVVKTMVDKMHEEVITKLHDYIVEDMKANLDAEIRRVASDVASSMLARALAGDDKEIRRLFGFNEWYMKHAYIGPLPTQWALIDAIVTRRPEIFLSERLAQRDAEIELLRCRVEDMTRRLAHYEDAT